MAFKLHVPLILLALTVCQVLCQAVNIVPEPTELKVWRRERRQWASALLCEMWCSEDSAVDSGRLRVREGPWTRRHQGHSLQCE